MTETAEPPFVKLPNPYEGLTQADGDRWIEMFPWLGDEDEEGTAGAVAAFRRDFDARVLPILLDPRQFLALEPLHRLWGCIDFITVHPDKHDQSMWGAFSWGDLGMSLSEVAESVMAPEPILEDVVPGVVYGRPYVRETWALNLPRPNAELSCGTAHCLAGWGVSFAGMTMVTLLRRDSLGIYSSDSQVISVDRVVDPATGGTAEISEEARDLFGLNSNQANQMFGGSNTIEYLRDQCAQPHGPDDWNDDDDDDD